MKFRKHWIIVALIIMVTTFIRENSSAYDMTEFFPLNQGDEWLSSAKTTQVGSETEDENETILLKVVVNGTELVNGVETIKQEYGQLHSTPSGYGCWVTDSQGIKLYKEYSVNGGFYSIYDPQMILFPAQFDLGEVFEGSFFYTVYSTDNDSLLYTTTANRTVTLESVEDVTVPAGIFKDSLKLTWSSFSQTSDNATYEGEGTVWRARNIGRIKSITTEKWHWSVPDEGFFEIISTSELESAKVNGKQYGCPLIFVLGEDSNELDLLRRFRDEVLCKTPIGRNIIKLYYQWSPAIVEAMEENKIFREKIREIIDGFLPIIIE